MTYSFDERLKAGQSGESVLDDVFKDRFVIVPATRDEQRLGIDRHFTNRETGVSFTVEYKTDWTASRTENAFVETVSVDSANKPGWAYSSQAYRLIYFVPGPPEIIYVMLMSIIREHLPRWIKTYPQRRIPNKGYFTHGVLVPLIEFEECAELVI